MVAMLLEPFVRYLRIIAARRIPFAASDYLYTVFVGRLQMGQAHSLFGLGCYPFNHLGDSIQIAAVQLFEFHAFRTAVYRFG